MEEENKKKIVCPYCNAEITELINIQDAVLEWTFFPDGSYTTEPEIEDGAGENVNEWVCPECKAHAISFSMEQSLNMVLLK